MDNNQENKALNNVSTDKKLFQQTIEVNENLPKILIEDKNEEFKLDVQSTPLNRKKNENQTNFSTKKLYETLQKIKNEI